MRCSQRSLLTNEDYFARIEIYRDCGDYQPPALRGATLPNLYLESGLTYWPESSVEPRLCKKNARAKN